MFLKIFMILYSMYAIWLYRFLNSAFKRYSFLQKKEIIQNDDYPAFTRNDYSKWNKTSFYLCGLILFPIRILTAIFSMLMTSLIIKLIGYSFGIKDPTQPYPLQCRKLINLAIWVQSRLFLFCFGIYKIEKKKIKLTDDQHSYFIKTKDSPDSIIISNHTNTFDMFVHCASTNYICFIANEFSKSYPMIGTIAQYLQCIFVNRKRSDSRSKCLSDLRQRIKNIKKYPNRKILFIFFINIRL